MELTKRRSLGLVFAALVAAVMVVTLAGCSGGGQQSDKQESSSADKTADVHMLSQVVVTDSNGTVTTDYTYDDKGNVETMTQSAGEQYQKVTYTYNDQGDIESMVNETAGVPTSKQTFEAPVTSGDTITYNWTLGADESTGEADEPAFKGSTVYTTADDGTRCTKYEQTTTFNDGNSSIVTMTYDDKGLVTDYTTAIEGPDDSKAEVTFEYKIDGTSGTVTVKAPNETYEMDITLDDDGHPTLLENKDKNIKVEFTYDANVPDATAFNRMMSQADLANYFTNIPIYFTDAYVSQVEAMIETTTPDQGNSTNEDTEGEVAVIDGNAEVATAETPEAEPTSTADQG